MLARALILSLVLCASAAAQPQNPDWRRPFPPVKLIGNVYWVGTYDLSTYLITTDGIADERNYLGLVLALLGLWPSRDARRFAGRQRPG